MLASWSAKVLDFINTDHLLPDYLNGGQNWTGDETSWYGTYVCHFYYVRVCAK